MQQPSRLAQPMTAPRSDRPTWADDIDTPEWRAILADPRFVAVLRRMMADVAAEIDATDETDAAA